ncbi:hypothetical protein GGF32_006365 [Allomyces javanicus]|nr:hypothetical protein GGF32_006365 [Allomyces javanicus]
MAMNYVTKTFFVRYSKKNREFNASLPFLKQEIPVVILLHALGLTNHELIKTMRRVVLNG